MCPVMRHDHDTHLLTKRSIRMCNVPLNIWICHCEWQYTIHHCKWYFTWPIWRLLWVETLTIGLKPCHPKWTPCTSTKYRLWLKHLWVWPNRLLLGMPIRILAIATHYLEKLSLVGGKMYLWIQADIEEMVSSFLMR